MVECPRCGGEMREGELFVRGAVSKATAYPNFGVMDMPEMNVQNGDVMGENEILWREKTGRKTGWLIKSDEEKTMKISGLRCIKCGYVELYCRE